MTVAKYKKANLTSKEIRALRYKRKLETERAIGAKKNGIYTTGSSPLSTPVSSNYTLDDFKYPKSNPLSKTRDALNPRRPKPNTSATRKAEREYNNFLKSNVDGEYVSHNIWGTVVSPEPYPGTPQHTIEQVMGIKNDDVLVALDLETIGAPGEDLFGITEIGVTPYKLRGDIDLAQIDNLSIAQSITNRKVPISVQDNVSGVMQKISDNDGIAILVNADEKSRKKAYDLLDAIEKGEEGALTVDEKRSMRRLYEYAGDANFGDKNQRGLIISPNSSRLTQATRLQDYTGELREGLSNLEKHGVSVDEALKMAQTYVDDELTKKGISTDNIKMFGQNIGSADIPWLREVVARTSTNKEAQDFLSKLEKNSVDMRAAMKEAIPDFWNKFYPDGSYAPGGRIAGISTQSQLYMQTFYKEMTNAHFSTADNIGAADIFGVWYPELRRKLKSGNLGVNEPVGASLTEVHNPISASNSRKIGIPGTKYDTTPIQKDDILFARRSGRSATHGDGFNLDTIREADGSVYSSDYSIWKNRTYKVQNEYVKDYNGVKIFGIDLLNEQDGTVHSITRTSREELQGAIQHSLGKLNSNNLGEIKAIQEYSQYDTARRSYEGLFTDGQKGMKKLELYGGKIKEIRGKINTGEIGNSPEAIQGYINRSRGLSRSQKRDLSNVYGRLDKEIDFLNDFMGSREFRALGSVEEKGLALRNLRRNIDKELGSKTRKLQLPESVRQLKMLNPLTREEVGINAASHSEFTVGLQNLLQSGNRGEMNLGNVKNNARSMAEDLYSRGLIRRSDLSAFLGENGILNALLDTTGTTRGVQPIAQQLNTMVSTNLLDKMAEAEIQSQMGFSDEASKILAGIESNFQKEIEVTDLSSEVYGGRTLNEALGTGGKGQQIIRSSTNAARNTFKDSNYNITNIKAVQDASEQATEKIMEVFGDNPVTQSIANLGEEIEDLSNVFRQNGLYVQTSLKKGRGGRYSSVDLLISATEDAKNIVASGNVDPEKIIRMSIPLADGNNILTAGNLSNLNRVSIIRSSNKPVGGGRIKAGTATNSMFHNLRMNAAGISDNIAHGEYSKARRTAKNSVASVMSGLSSGSRYAKDQIIDDLVFSNTHSAWLKTGNVDLTQVIDNMFKNSDYKHNVRGRDVKINSSKDLFLGERLSLIRDLTYGGSSFNGEKIEYKTAYGENLKKEINSELGIDLTLDAIRMNQGTGFVFSLNDPRALEPFGYFTTNAKEQIRQGQNYYLLDMDGPLYNPSVSGSGFSRTPLESRESYIKKNLSLTGKSPAEVEKAYSALLSPTMSTETFESQRVAGNKVTGLSVVGANVTDDVLKEIIIDANSEEYWNNLSAFDKPSVNENMIVMRESVANSFTTTREKVFMVDPSKGQKVSEDIVEAWQLMKDGQNIQYYLPGYNDGDEVVSVGNLVTDSVRGKSVPGLPGSSTSSLEYRGPNAARLRGIEELEDGRKRIVFDELMPVNTGTKFATTVKGTATVIPDSAENNVWQQLFGKNWDDTGFFFFRSNVKSDINQMDMLTGELEYALSNFIENKVTVGKIEKAKAQQEAAEIINDMFNGRAKAYYQNDRLIIPDSKLLEEATSAGGPIEITLERVNETINNLYGGRTRGKVSPGGTQIPLGIYGLKRMNVEDYPRGSGAMPSPGEGVKYGPREVSYLRAHSRHYANQGDTATSEAADYVAKWLEAEVTDISGSSSKSRELRSYYSSLSYLQSGNTLPGYGDFENLNKYLSAGPSKDGWVSFGESGSLNILAKNVSGGYTESEIRGTMLDESISKGKGFLYQIPAVKVDGKAVDTLYMPYVPNQYINGNIQPTDVQSAMIGIQDSVTRMANTSGADYDTARKDLERNVNRFYGAQSSAITSSGGSVVEDVFKKRMPHSAALKSRGFNISEYKTGTGADSIHGEGYTYITEKRAKQMVQGLGEEESSRVLGLMKGDEGYAALYNRYPTIGKGSITPTMVKVAEGVTMGDDEIRLTLGSIARSAADFDGDYGELVLARVGGKDGKSTNFLRGGQISQLELEGNIKKTWEREREVNEWMGSWVHDKLSKEQGGNLHLQDFDTEEGSKKIQNFVSSNKGDLWKSFRTQFGDDALILGVESRLQMTIGPFSNIHKKYATLAETVEGFGGRNTVGGLSISEIIGAYGTTFEQGPISSKHIANALKRENIDIIDYIEGADNLKKSMSSMKKDSISDIMQSARIANILEEETVDGTSRWVLGGRGAAEYAAGHDGAKIYQEDLENVFSTLFDSADEVGINKATLDVFGSEKGSPEEQISSTMQFIEDLTSGKTSTASEESITYMRGLGYSENQIGDAIKRSDELLATRLIDNVPAGGIGRSGEAISEAVETIGSNKAAALSGAGDKILSSFKKPGTAIALGVAGAWAVGSMMRGPSVEREQVQTREDQAPSSDGGYVDFNKYAQGAPQGAGPSPYLSELGTGYERMNVNIRGSARGNLTDQEIANMISTEIQRQAGIDINLNIRQEDNRQSINSQWLQNQFMSALKTGYVY